MKELTRHDDGRILCECRKCYQICRDGVYLIPRTYRNHKKYRDLDPDEEELEHRAARAAFFKKWGKPNTSSASSSSSQMHTRRRKKKSKAAHKTTVPPLPLDEDMSADAEIQYMDDRDDLDVPIYGDVSTGDALTPGSASTQGKGLMGDAPMQGDVPTQGDASVGGAQDEEEAPVDPSSARRTCDESDEEDSEEDLGTPGPVPDFDQPQLGEQLEDEDEGHDSTNISLNLNDPLPQPTLSKLVLIKDMVEDVNSARLEDDLDEQMLGRLRNPPKEPESLASDILFSMALFNNLMGGSEQMYHDTCQTIKHFTGRTLESYHKVKTKVENTTGVAQLRNDMCVRSCVAFTGPLKELDKCPECNEDRYQKNKKSGKLQPRQQFYTIPLGPQLQAMWRTPEGADRMRYRNRKTDEIIQKIFDERKISSFEDVFHGSEYIDACRDKRIHPNDVFVMFSFDGAQLYRDKASDAWFAIWVILNLSPDLRYKKKYVLPAFFVPGPKKPENMDSFLLPSFRHVSALQKEGLQVYDGRLGCLITSRPFFGFGTADTLALPLLSGLVGHNGQNGCRLSCGMPGRHPPGKPTYYPVVLQPKDYTIAKCNHADYDLSKLGPPDAMKYQQNLRKVLISPNETRYKCNRLLTGICQPSICLGLQLKSMVPVPQCFTLDLMHLVSLNIPSHLVSIWRNSSDARITYEDLPKPDFIVLDNDEDWKEHGKLVKSTHPYFPGSFDRLPRDPSKKINSGYKAIEWLNYFWVLGPALFRIVLPHHLWQHYCRLVCGIRLLHQRVITEEELQRAHNLLTQCVTADVYTKLYKAKQRSSSWRTTSVKRFLGSRLYFHQSDEPSTTMVLLS
ncbi:hypothetical protein M378DRAFT_18358 [Amanita muscaria Koide BX008]|uniref:Transposase domain-containing protein n=1 Tax=Amanita muscaria (strain Koide BX008) TaxID=946122 RepID=A0A0C2SM30_AMAMK|nr:hypothetical protein M378DRAFT_18358 [Amanita muscaria Koide BX008]